MLFARSSAVFVLGGIDLLLPSSRRPPIQRHPHPKRPDPVLLTSDDVAAVVQAAAASVNSDALVIAVSDRQGDILAIYKEALAAPATSTANFGIQADTKEVAVALARTTSFFSNDQAPLSSRTVRFISGIHFPPGIAFTSNAPLYGIENTNRGCPFNADYVPGQEFPPARSINGARTWARHPYRKSESDRQRWHSRLIRVAFRCSEARRAGGRRGRGGRARPMSPSSPLSPDPVWSQPGAHPAAPGVVIVGGIALPFVNQTTMPAGYGPGTADGSYVLGPLSSPKPRRPKVIWWHPRTTSPGRTHGRRSDGHRERHRSPGQSHARRDSIAHRIARHGLRSRWRIWMARCWLCIGCRTRRFSASTSRWPNRRNVIFFSGPNRLATDLPGVPMGTAVTNRTIGFGGQPIYPPGIDGTAPGPFFPLYLFDTMNPCTQGSQPHNANQNGIVFFPGALPLYRERCLNRRPRRLRRRRRPGRLRHLRRRQ